MPCYGTLMVGQARAGPLDRQSTTCFGHRLRCRQSAPIQEVVRTLAKLRRTELGHLLFTPLRWRTQKGQPRMQRALRLLEALEPLGILRLAPKRGGERPRQQPLVPAPLPALAEPFRALLPLQLCCLTDAQEVALGNAFLERYHPLGYRRPSGPPGRCFLRDRQGRIALPGGWHREEPPSDHPSVLTAPPPTLNPGFP